MHDDRLVGRHVIVTGAAQGIGRGIATRIARAGADVAVFDTQRQRAGETAALVREAGRRAAAIEVDVSDEASVEAGVDEAVEQLGPVHGLVNNAGVQRAVPILETSVDDWAFHQSVNARGTFLCSKAVAWRMVDAGDEGAIVNVASTAAERPFPGQGAYAASKAGVVAFTLVLAKELGEHGIRANAINPGTVDTPMVRQWLEENAAASGRTEEAILEDALAGHTIRRMGRPEEIGHVATLLLSAEGEWITGEVIDVDGGYTSE